MGKRRKLRSNEFDLPGQVCPVCGYKADTVSNPFGDSAPAAGSFAICVNCGEINQFDDALKLQSPKPEELFRLMLDNTDDRWKRVELAQELIRRRRQR